MSNLLLLPAKFLGWAAVGAALGIGWKVGTLVYDTVEKAVREQDIKWPQVCPKEATEEHGEAKPST